MAADARMLGNLSSVGQGEPLSAPPDLAFFDCETGLGPDPHVWIDVDETMDVRRRALACHASQGQNVGEPSLVEFTDGLARQRGIQRGCQYAEGFRGCGTWPAPDGAIRRLVSLLESGSPTGSGRANPSSPPRQD
jgi:hypothetical protein